MTETREDDAEGRGGKKREQGGRSFREDSHAHHYFNIRPHVGDDFCLTYFRIFAKFQSTSPRGGRLKMVNLFPIICISIHVPTWGTTCFL